MNDGAPTRDFKQFIDYLEEREGRIGPVLWPPQSADLTPVEPFGTQFTGKRSTGGTSLAFEAAVTRIFLKVSREPGISGVIGLSCAN
jgi:hypothetical protein